MDAEESHDPSYREHVPVFEAIEARNGAAAGEAMRIHMEGAACRLNAAVAAHNAEKKVAPG